MTLPTALTLLRMGLIPVIVVVFYAPGDWSRTLCAAIFALAALTDWLDGYLARRLQQTSAFGEFLDPVADKLMVATALVLLLQSDPTIVLALPVLVIIGREIAISALREWMATVGERRRVRVMWLSKVKTLAQLTAIVCLLFRESLLGLPIYRIGLVLLYIATVLTLWSMVNYLRAAGPTLGAGLVKPSARPPEPAKPGRAAADADAP